MHITLPSKFHPWRRYWSIPFNVLSGYKRRRKINTETFIMNRCDWAFTYRGVHEVASNIYEKKTLFVKKKVQKDPSTKFLRFTDP